MQKFSFFIDESGTATLDNLKSSPFFTLCGVVVNESNRQKLCEDINNLKLKYFGKKNYILHAAELHHDLKSQKRIEEFAKDLEKILNKHQFFLLYVVVDKDKARKWSWTKETIYKKTYRVIVGNLIKFLIAKNAMGQIIAEASSVVQDIYLYQSLFHYIANGIDRLNLTPPQIKQHLTSLSFVTKINNDPEEQLADLFGMCGKFEGLNARKQLKEDELSAVAKVLFNQMKKKLFKGTVAKTAQKKKLYKEMNPCVFLP